MYERRSLPLPLSLSVRFSHWLAAAWLVPNEIGGRWAGRKREDLKRMGRGKESGTRREDR